MDEKDNVLVPTKLNATSVGDAARNNLDQGIITISAILASFFLFLLHAFIHGI